MLGAASLQFRMQTAELEAYQRTQAIVLLQDMVARINANRKSAADYVTAAICLEADDGPNATATDQADPPVGGVFIYLLRAENGCAAGQGSLGTDSAGTPRVGLLCP